MNVDQCESYLQDIYHIFRDRDSTEASYYNFLAKFIKELSLSEFNKRLEIIQNPKKIKNDKEIIGLPDFLVKNDEGDIVGYIEAKDPRLTNLESIYDTDQISRYKKLPNLILTNFIEFHHFRNGQKMKMVNISNVPLIAAHHIPKPKNLQALNELLEQFLSFSVKHVSNAHDLAMELANRAQLLRRVTIEELESGLELINNIYVIFSQQLIHDLTITDFADMYAQTIAYGLFFARMQAKDNGFYRSNAYSYIPSSTLVFLALFVNNRCFLQFFH